MRSSAKRILLLYSRGMRGRAWLWPIGLAILGIAFALVPLAQGRFFFYWDNASQHYPAQRYLTESLRNGQLPMSWPQVMAGFPLVAEGQAAHFQPIHLALSWLLSAPAAFMVEIGIGFALTGLGMYAFLRLFRLRRVVCGTAALMLMFSSLAVSQVRNAALIRASCCFTLAMYFAERYARRRRAVDGAGLALMVALQLLSGYPTPSLIAAGAVVLHVVVRTMQLGSRRQSRKARIARAAVAGAGAGLFIALGAAMAAIQLAPTAAQVPPSIRAVGLTTAFATTYLSSNPNHWLQWTMPYALHPLRAVTNEDEGTARSVGWFYMGALAPLATVAAFWWRRRRTHVTWVLGLGAAVSAVFAVGYRTPLMPLLTKLPVFDSFRYPSRMILWTSFCCAALAAFGLQHLLVHARRRQPFPWRFLGLWTVGLLASAGIVFLAHASLRGIAVSLMFAVVAMAAAVALLSSSPRRRGLALIVMTATVVLDLGFFRVVVNYGRTVPIEATLKPDPIVEWLQHDPDQFRILAIRTPGMGPTEQGPGLLTGPSSTLWGLEGMRTNFSLPFSRPLLLGEMLEQWMTDHIDEVDRVAGLLGAMNVKYVLSWRNVPIPKWQDAPAEGPLGAWRNPSFLPRAFLVGHAVAAPALSDPRSALTIAGTYLNYVRRPDHFLDDVSIVERYLQTPIDMSTTAIIEADTVPQLPGLGEVHRVSARKTPPDLAIYDVESDRNALLYVSSYPGPGWTATVNGAPARIYLTNWIGTGIEVPAGASRVELRYALPGLTRGAATTAAAGLIWLGILTGSIARRRTRR